VPVSKRRPLPTKIFQFSKPWQWRVQVSQILQCKGPQACKTLHLVGKLKSRRAFTGSAAMSAHATATAMHFPADAGLIFLTEELTNDRFLVDIGATLSIVPCSSNRGLSEPLLKGANGKPIPSWGFITKIVQFQGKMFTSSFLQAAVTGLILGIDFLQKFKVTFAPETSQIMFACAAPAQTTAKPSLPSFFSAQLERPHHRDRLHHLPHRW
jgi:hypothetical protein